MSTPALLIDTYSLVFRAFYALPPMNASTGEPTSALYGFSVLLLKLLREEAPSALAFALDVGASFRQAQYPDYKGERGPTPSPLRSQLRRLPELLAAFGVPLHGVAGFEADDVLATLATELAEQGDTALIVSGDRDLLQLCGPAVEVLFVGRRGQDHVRYDAAAVAKRFGLAPAQLPERAAFVGDPSDNLPGLPGVGDKTAARWLAEHGDVAGVLAHVDALKPARLREVVREHRDQLVRTAELARLRRDVPLGNEERVGPLTDVAMAALRTQFEVLEFRSLLPRLEALA